jgi:hypothetical protein
VPSFGRILGNLGARVRASQGEKRHRRSIRAFCRKTLEPELLQVRLILNDSTGNKIHELMRQPLRAKTSMPHLIWSRT